MGTTVLHERVTLFTGANNPVSSTVSHANHSGRLPEVRGAHGAAQSSQPLPAHLHTVGRGLPEFVLIQLQRVSREDVWVLATHVAELLKQLWLILGKVKGLHWPRGRVGHHRHTHSGQLVATATYPLYLADSIQDGIHLGLEALLAHKHVLISRSIKAQDDFQIAGWQGEMKVKRKMRSSTCKLRKQLILTLSPSQGPKLWPLEYMFTLWGLRVLVIWAQSCIFGI